MMIQNFQLKIKEYGILGEGPNVNQSKGKGDKVLSSF